MLMYTHPQTGGKVYDSQMIEVLPRRRSRCPFCGHASHVRMCAPLRAAMDGDEDMEEGPDNMDGPPDRARR